MLFSQTLYTDKSLRDFSNSRQVQHFTCFENMPNKSQILGIDM